MFLKYISSHTHAFSSSISMLWGVSKMCLCYFQKLCFFSKKFVSLCLLRLIQSVFRSIEIVIKFLRKPLSALIDPICFSIKRNCFKIFKRSLCLFRSIKNRESGFSKSEFDLFKLTFQKVFQTFLSLRIGQG